MDVIDVVMDGVMPLLQAAVSHRAPTAGGEASGQAKKPGSPAPNKTIRQARRDRSNSAIEVAVRHTTTRYHL